MKSVRSSIVVVGALAIAVVASGAETRASEARSPISRCTIIWARKHSLADGQDKKAIVIAFLGVECPLARQYGSRLAELAAKYEPQGAAFIGIDSNQQDSLAEIAHFARETHIEFPILKDPATPSPISSPRSERRRCLSSTPIAPSVTGGESMISTVWATRAAAPTRSFIADALDDLLAGKEVRESAQTPVGCFIGRVQRSAASGDVTYTRNIASILHQRCAWCHHAGEVAPFSLTTYDEVVGWAETIVEVIAEGRMPPWHANPQHGKFVNDFRLPERERS